MSNATKMPSVVSHFWYSFEDFVGVRFNINRDWCGKDDDTLVVYRSSKRWRCVGYQGFYPKHHIAMALFEYSERPCQDEIDLMESFVDLVAMSLDMADEYYMWRLEQNQKRRELESQRQVEWLPPENIPTSISSSVSYVYLMKHSNGLVKIGFSNNPKARERTLQAEDPRLEMIHSYVGTMELERALHGIYKDVRVRGEWFRLTESQVDWIAWYLRTRKCD